MPPTVLIVDDHGPFRSFARALLDASGFDVIGEAADGASAVEAFRRLGPEVVLLDVQLPDLDGFAVAERLAREQNCPKVVLISTREASAYRRRLQSAAACGFIPKSELSGETLAAILA
jgi:DNA-binding NarL/FixJ family response regulator